MSASDLDEFMRQMRAYFASEYRRVQRRVKEDAGLAGAQAEEHWAQLLRDWLPHTYHVVTRGRIMSPRGDASPEIDILVLHSSYPKYLLNKKYYLCGGVVAAFECKLTLRPDHLPKIVDTCARVKQIAQASDASELKYDACSPIFGILAHTQQRFVSRHTDPERKSGAAMEIGWALQRQLAERVVSVHDVPDLLCVADLATLYRDHSDLTLAFGLECAQDDGVDGADDSDRDRVAYTWARIKDEDGDSGDALGWLVSSLVGKLTITDPSLMRLHSFFHAAFKSQGYGGQYMILKSKREK